MNKILVLFGKIIAILIVATALVALAYFIINSSNLRPRSTITKINTPATTPTINENHNLPDDNISYPGDANGERTSADGQWTAQAIILANEDSKLTIANKSGWIRTIIASGTTPVGFSPDNHWLVYEAMSDQSVDSLFAVRLDEPTTMPIVQLTNSGLNNVGPSFIESPIEQTVKWNGNDIFYYQNPGRDITSIDLASSRYTDIFSKATNPSAIADNKIDWINILVDNFQLDVPYSNKWSDGWKMITPYDIDQLGDNTIIRFGKPIGLGTWVKREYYIYRGSKLSTKQIENITLSGCGGQQAHGVNTKLGDVQGVKYFYDNVKACYVGFVFNKGTHAYYLFRDPSPETPLPTLDDEMEKIVTSIKQ